MVIKPGKVVIVLAATPPTNLTVGKSAVPPKSFVNFKIPFTDRSASGIWVAILFVTNAVVAIWVVLVPAAAVGAVGMPSKVGLVKVLFVKVSTPDSVAKVPDRGNVTAVFPEVVIESVLDPIVVNAPPSVSVLVPLFTPVPP